MLAELVWEWQKTGNLVKRSLLPVLCLLVQACLVSLWCPARRKRGNCKNYLPPSMRKEREEKKELYSPGVVF